MFRRECQQLEEIRRPFAEGLGRDALAAEGDLESSEEGNVESDAPEYNE